ncbi:SRPBCC family protein [Stakelama tenebrarum]|uniref:SRPBCC domain-containing protein n=1 Tax=Stakelama tenebrarum TaxID=2711215 RepID=A0A6G6Y262_9SPHN|nr:SRPBCC domain-containing protein [Sphingosinithalassobacter tenebrarum]QIG79034.1 SRPBCC domain-containing protein [Sphingosinithalassobacter tenebrarum]
MAAALRLTLLRRYPTPAHIVFAAWTQPHLLSRWWAGRDGMVALAQIDPRIGGSFIIDSKRAKDGAAEEWGVFNAVEDQELLEFSWCARTADMHRVTVQFLALEDALTEVSLVHFGFADEAACAAQQARWEIALDALGEFLANIATDG